MKEEEQYISGMEGLHRERDPEAQHHHHHEQVDGGSEDDLDTDSDEDTPDSSVRSTAALEEQFHWLETEVATLVADVHDLTLYTKLNLTGFMKILKVSRSTTSALMLSNLAGRNMTYVF